jgi:hypothetical protein
VGDPRAEGVRVAYPLFQAEGGGSTPTSALQLTVEEIGFADARALNRLWHSRLPRIGDPACVMRAGIHYGAVFGGLWYAAAIWSHPVARKLPQETWLELRRLAIAPDAPKNTATRMLAVMTRLIRKARPGLVRLISYQDTAVHTGGIYRAAGWVEGEPAEESNTQWDMPGRSRPKSQSDAPKQRWELPL